MVRTEVLTKRGLARYRGMAKALVSDELWAALSTLLPSELPKPKGGRPRLPDRAVLTDILFVLQSGLLWEMLPVEMGYGSRMSCWHRLRDWQQAGVWVALHRQLPERRWTVPRFPQKGGRLCRIGLYHGRADRSIANRGYRNPAIRVYARS